MLKKKHLQKILLYLSLIYTVCLFWFGGYGIVGTPPHFPLIFSLSLIWRALFLMLCVVSVVQSRRRPAASGFVRMTYLNTKLYGRFNTSSTAAILSSNSTHTHTHCRTLIRDSQHTVANIALLHKAPNMLWYFIKIYVIIRSRNIMYRYCKWHGLLNMAIIYLLR